MVAPKSMTVEGSITGNSTAGRASRDSTFVSGSPLSAALHRSYYAHRQYLMVDLRAFASDFGE